MRFIEGRARDQATPLPEYLADFVDDDNPVRVVDAYVDSLDLSAFGDYRRCSEGAGTTVISEYF